MTTICAILCQNLSRATMTVLLLTVLATGCKDLGISPVGLGVAGSGGALGGGGTGEGGTGGTASPDDGGAGSAVNTGGGGGAKEVTDCAALRSYPDCGTCTITLEAYCNAPNSCQLDETSVCKRIWWGSTWERGCGYVRVKYWGDVNDYVTNIWDEASGKLVYHWFNGMLSMGCLPDTHAGTEPKCEEWTDACSPGGAGGMAGAAGQVNLP